MNEPRVYKNSPFMFIFLLLVFGVAFVGLFNLWLQDSGIFLLPIGLGSGILFVVLLLSVTSKTIISSDEISTQNLLGTKTLRWSEINQVSGRGYAIKLQDIDRGLTVAPSPQLPGYHEVVDWIGLQRPDLFSPINHAEMSRSWLQTFSYIAFGFVFIGMGLFAYLQESNTFFPFLFISVVGIGFIGMTLLAPQSLSIQGNSLMIRYFFNQKTLSANEITSVDLRFTQTRNGKQYYATLTLLNRKTMRISGFGSNLPVVYLVLKNWHKANTGIH